VNDFKLLWAMPLFRRLLGARAISNFGNGMAPIAMSFGVLDLPGANATSLSAVLTVHAIALIVTLPFGGVLADRFPRAKVIAVTDMVLASVVITVGVLFLTDSATVPLLMALNILAGVLNGLWYPAFPGLTPDVVQDQHLQSANAVVAVASNTCLILGVTVGGIIVSQLGSGLAFVLDGLTFLTAGILVWTLRRVSKAHPSGESIVRDLRDGWSSFISFRWVAVIVGAFSFIVAAFQASSGVLGPVLMRQEFQGASSWAIVLGAQSAGFLIGAGLATKLRPRHPMRFGMFITLAAAMWMFSMAVPMPLLVIAAAAFLWGIAMDLFYVLWITALQTHVPRDVFSRVNSYDAMGSLILGPLGIALAGPAVAAIGLRPAFVIAGCVVVVAVLASLLEPTVRSLRGGPASEPIELPDMDHSAPPLGVHTPPAV
jgi:MFS family permease